MKQIKQNIWQNMFVIFSKLFCNSVICVRQMCRLMKTALCLFLFLVWKKVSIG